jgi:hypothetical protein
VQQKRCALERRQAIERQQQRNGEVFGQLGAAVRSERCRIDDRLRQPRTDVLLPAHAGR